MTFLRSAIEVIGSTGFAGAIQYYWTGYFAPPGAVFALSPQTSVSYPLAMAAIQMTAHGVSDMAETLILRNPAVIKPAIIRDVEPFVKPLVIFGVVGALPYLNVSDSVDPSFLREAFVGAATSMMADYLAEKVGMALA